MGTDSTNAYGRETRGRDVRELNLGDFSHFWQEAFALVRGSGTPALAAGSYRNSMELLDVEAVLAPLSDDGANGAAFTSVACDKHPDYASTRFADAMGLPRVAVQHHLAHVLACLLEHRQPPAGVLGIAWDGTGYGEDGTIWGGEFILLEKGVARRFARLRPFRLAGGDAAMREPRRVALGLLHEMNDDRFGELAGEFGVSGGDVHVLWAMLTRRLNSPVTSSAGRLFDAVGALLGLGLKNQFEGQTPLAVEAAAVSVRGTHLPLPLAIARRRRRWGRRLRTRLAAAH